MKATPAVSRPVANSDGSAVTNERQQRRGGAPNRVVRGGGDQREVQGVRDQELDQHDSPRTTAGRSCPIGAKPSISRPPASAKAAATATLNSEPVQRPRVDRRIEERAGARRAATAGAGPSSAIARTIARNEPESRRPQISNAQQLAAGGRARSTGRAAASERQSVGVARRARRRPARRRVQRRRRATGSRVDGPSTPGHRHPRKFRSAYVPTAPLARHLRATVVAECGGVLNRCGCGRSAGCWASYTVNDLGDSIGVVALAVLVFDRTEDVAPTAGFFLVAQVPARAVRDRADRAPGPVAGAARAADDLRGRGRSCSAALGLTGLARAASSCRSCSLLGLRRRHAGDHRPRAHARGRRGGAAAATGC